MKDLITLLLFALTMLTSGTATAQGGDPGSLRGPLAVVARLGLGAETQASVAGIVKEFRQSSALLDAEVLEVHESIFALLNSEPPDKASVMAEVEVLGELEAQLRAARFSAMFDIRALLSPEQRAELVSMRRRHTEQALDACSEDIQQLCPEFEGSRGALRCLSRMRTELAPACQEAMPEKGKRPGPRGRRALRGL